MSKKCVKYFFVLFVSIFSACSEGVDDSSVEVPGNVIISSVGIEGDGEMVELLSDLTSNSDNQKFTASTNSSASLKSKYVIQEHDEFDYTVNLLTNTKTQADADRITKLGISQIPSIKGSKIAADVPFAGSKKFRLVIYLKNQYTTPVYNGVLEVGQKPNVLLSYNKAYDWFAFTIGDASSVPDIDGTGQVAKDAIANKDFMYAKGTLTVSAAENYLKIIFKRQTSRLQITLNTRGIFGPMQNSSSLTVGETSSGQFVSLFQTGVFNILTGQYTNLTDITGVSASTAINISDKWVNEEKLFTLYTAVNTDKEISIGKLAVKLNSLSITLDDMNTRTFNSGNIIPVNSIYQFFLRKGYTASTTVRLVESPVIVDGVKWARTNLIYDSNKLYGANFIFEQSNAYRFRPNNNYSIGIANEYWNYVTTTPLATNVNGDAPCQRVYPEYTWNMASDYHNEAFLKLEQKPYTYTVTPMSDNTYRHSFVWAGEGEANSAYPDNNLTFSFLGKRVNGGTIVDNPRASVNSAGELYMYRGYQQQLAIGSDTYNVFTFNSKKLQNATPGPFIVGVTNGLEGYVIRCVRMN